MSALHPLLARLGVTHPIIQAPMAGVSTPALAAAVTDAGALGSIAVGAGTVAQAVAQIAQTRALTRGPFNVNVFCHAPATRNAARESAWIARLTPTFRSFGAEPPSSLREIYDTAVGNEALLAALLDARPAVVSFHFGLPGGRWVDALRGAGVVTFACVTNTDEALLAERAGVDVLVAQGYEAGGHRGVFDPSRDDAMGTFALVRSLTTRSALPVIAAGGVMDGAGISAAFRLGAVAAQMGTAFVLCPESSASAAHRAALASGARTSVTSAFSGRPARGVVNAMHAFGDEGVPDYPVAYDAAKALHAAAAAKGSPDYGAHWAGQGAALARALPAAELVQTLVDEWRRAEA